MSTLNVNAIDKESGSTLTLGGSGTAVTLHASATSSGFDSGLASVQTFTSSGTWTRPSGITKVIMEVQGAGGSGSGSPNTEDVTGAGAGGYAKKFLDVSSISTSTITVGAGGVGVSGTGVNAGNAGGNSSWADGTNTITGTGGAGGVLTHDSPTEGSTATGGDINIQGGDGLARYLGDQFTGGDSTLGHGGMGKATTRTTVARLPRGYGAGSGGAYNTGSSETGGAGIVIVWEYK
jgi:hypothetical protein